MNGPYCSARIIYFWDCSACRSTTQISAVVGRSEEIPRPPKVPEGWQVVDDGRDGRLLCPAHKVAVLVDGAVLS
jgi:hypothetical protein